MALFRRRSQPGPQPGQQPGWAPSGQQGPGQPGPGLPPGQSGPAGAQAFGGDLRQALMTAPVDRVRQDLRLMVTRPGPHLGQAGMTWPLGVSGEIAAVACVKLPDGAAVTVEAAMAQTWGMTPEDLWLQAALNLRNEQFGVQKFDTTVGTPMTMLNGQGWPGSAQLFRLGEALGEALPAGALVAMPVENMLFTLPIRSARALHMVPFILDTGVELTRGQQPLSTRMFWWHEGVLEELSVERTGPNDARVSGSGRFGQAMGSL